MRELGVPGSGAMRMVALIKTRREAIIKPLTPPTRTR